MSDEHAAHVLGVRIDIDVDLHEDGEPNVLRANDEMMVLIVGVHGTIDKSILRRYEGPIGGIFEG